MTLDDLKKLIRNLAKDGLDTSLLQCVGKTVDRTVSRKGKKVKVNLDSVFQGIIGADELFRYEHGGIPMFSTPAGDVLLSVAATVSQQVEDARQYGPEPVVAQSVG